MQPVDKLVDFPQFLNDVLRLILRDVDLPDVEVDLDLLVLVHLALVEVGCVTVLDFLFPADCGQLLLVHIDLAGFSFETHSLVTYRLYNSLLLDVHECVSGVSVDVHTLVEVLSHAVLVSQGDSFAVLLDCLEFSELQNSLDFAQVVLVVFHN